MSIDDDIFDVIDTLSNTDGEKAFERIMDHINNVELAHDELHKENIELRAAVRAMMKVKEDNE